jgi:hypothetical protein
MVVDRFTALYSINRLPGKLMAIDILQDVWQARDPPYHVPGDHLP